MSTNSPLGYGAELGDDPVAAEEARYQHYTAMKNRISRSYLRQRLGFTVPLARILFE